MGQQWVARRKAIRPMAALLFVVLLCGCGINTIPTEEEQAKAAWSGAGIFSRPIGCGASVGMMGADDKKTLARKRVIETLEDNEVLVGAELRRVDEERTRETRGTCAALAHQREMTLVQKAHRGHEGKRLTPTARVLGPALHLRRRGDNLHSAQAPLRP